MTELIGRITFADLLGCHTEKCGLPRVGRPPKNWIRARGPFGGPVVWYCSAGCIDRIGAKVEPAPRYGVNKREVWTHEVQCGQLGKRGSTPPSDWLAISRPYNGKAAGHRVDMRLWFCSARCVAAALGVIPDDPAERSMASDLRSLNRLAGTDLTIMTVTPRRVSFALARAYEHLVTELADWQRQQDAQRPTTAQLLDEATIDHEVGQGRGRPPGGVTQHASAALARPDEA